MSLPLSGGRAAEHKQGFAYFLSYFKTIIKIADPGWIFHVWWGGWELQPSASSTASLPLNRDVVCVGDKDVGSVLAQSPAPRHTHLWLNILCPPPIRAAQHFNVCLYICSPLYPGCSNNDLLFKQREHKGVTLAYYTALILMRYSNNNDDINNTLFIRQLSEQSYKVFYMVQTEIYQQYIPVKYYIKWNVFGIYLCLNKKSKTIWWKEFLICTQRNMLVKKKNVEWKTEWCKLKSLIYCSS